MKTKTPKATLPVALPLVCRALDEKKAEDIRVLRVSEQSSITDYLVLATGTSEPHLRALRVELEKVLDSAKVHIVGMDTRQESGWLVIDVFDVMVHVLTPENRTRYALENLWKDAEDIPVAKILAEPKKRAAKPTKEAKPKRTAAAKKPSSRKSAKKSA